MFCETKGILKPKTDKIFVSAIVKLNKELYA